MLNLVLMTGRIGTEPTIRVAGKYQLIEFCLVNERYIGEKKLASSFWINYWDPKKFPLFKKGQMITIEGKLQCNVFFDKEGIKQNRVKIDAKEVVFISEEKIIKEKEEEKEEERPPKNKTEMKERTMRILRKDEPTKEDLEEIKPIENFTQLKSPNDFAEGDIPF